LGRHRRPCSSGRTSECADALSTPQKGEAKLNFRVLTSFALMPTVADESPGGGGSHRQPFGKASYLMSSAAPPKHLASVVFVVPAFNEGANIAGLLSDLAARSEFFPPGSRLLLVDDGSSDDTVAVALANARGLPLEVVRLGVNRGPGVAFREGFAEALLRCSPDALIVTMESDRTSDLDALAEMLARARAGADLVLASVHGGGKMLNVPAVRRILSQGAGAVVRRTLDLEARTVSSFFRVYRAEILRQGFARFGDDLIKEPGFACKAEILAKLAAMGASIEEVPVDLDASRRVDTSKMRLAPTLAGYWRLTRERRRIRRTAGT
jgi:dolichol-phosphate mannosyltransferase